MDIELTATEDENDFEWPSLKENGWLVVDVVEKDGKLELREWDYDGGVVFWIQEGVGFDYYVFDIVGINEVGTWYIGDIEGHFTRGDGWTTDDNVDYYSAEPRLATDEEKASIV